MLTYIKIQPEPWPYRSFNINKHTTLYYTLLRNCIMAGDLHHDIYLTKSLNMIRNVLFNILTLSICTTTFTSCTKSIDDKLEG